MTTGRPKHLSSFVPKATEKVMDKQSAMFGRLVTAWDTIAGPSIAAHATLVKLKFSGGRGKQQKMQAVLHLAVKGAFAPEIMHGKAQLIERLNGFLGYNAISDVVLTHREPDRTEKRKRRKAPKTPAVKDEAKSAEIGRLTADIPDEELQKALNRLGDAIISRQSGD